MNTRGRTDPRVEQADLLLCSARRPPSHDRFTRSTLRRGVPKPDRVRQEDMGLWRRRIPIPDLDRPTAVDYEPELLRQAAPIDGPTPTLDSPPLRRPPPDDFQTIPKTEHPTAPNTPQHPLLCGPHLCGACVAFLTFRTIPIRCAASIRASPVFSAKVSGR